MMAPRFWSSQPTWQAYLLSPLGWIYGMVVRLRFAFARPLKVNVPVICIGNFTLGGSGKTPVVIAFAHRLKEFGERPFVLSRGYGGRYRGPYLVDPHKDNAMDVGDEALLIARHAPVIVAKDRRSGANYAIKRGASVLVLDDGMQNPTLAKDWTFVVVDELGGFGNGFVFPAGPLRAPLGWQEKLADAVILAAPESSVNPNTFKLQAEKFFSGKLKPSDAGWLAGQNILAFCGIGGPQRFRASLEAAGAKIARFEIFPDHHVYSAEEAKFLIGAAAQKNLALVTTEKDFARLQSLEHTRAQLAGLVNVLAVNFVPDDPAAFDALIRSCLSPADGALAPRPARNRLPGVPRSSI